MYATERSAGCNQKIPKEKAGYVISFRNTCRAVHRENPAILVPVSFSTADLCDKYEGRLGIAEPLFRDFGGVTRFNGPITTVRCPGDNSPVRATLQTPGKGGVLVIDGAGWLNFALLGDKLGAHAVNNGWSGLIIYGCIRDSEILATLQLGIKALAAYPLRTPKKDPGEKNVPLRFAGVDFIPGQHLYADPDGIVVSDAKLD